MRDCQRAKKIQSRGANCQILPVCSKQDVVTDAELDIPVSAQAIRVVGSTLNPVQVYRFEYYHDVLSPMLNDQAHRPRQKLPFTAMFRSSM